MTAIHRIACCLVLGSAVALAQEPSEVAFKARVRGVVISVENGAPIAGALVQLSGINHPGAGRSAVWNESRTTRADGAFDYSNIPDGEYSLSVAKPGYFMTSMTRVSASTRVAPVTIRMTRGGAITGRVLDEFGDPVAHVQVQAYLTLSARLGFMAPSGMGDSTDDRGWFRVYGLDPGEYRVVATLTNPSTSQPSVVGRPGNPARPPTYYPGTLDVARAQPIAVGAGQEASVEFALQPGGLYRIQGKVVASNGAPLPDAQILLRGQTVLVGRFDGRSRGDGAFDLTGVAPGRYVIEALTAAPGGSERGFVDVALGDGDLAGVSIATSRSATLTGTIVFEGDASSRSSGIRLRSIEPDMLGTGTLALLPDGRFEAKNVFGRVIVESGDSNWIVKSVTLAGANVLDRGIDVSGRDTVSGIRIVLTDKLTAVAGRAVDSRGRPLADHVVVLFRTSGVPRRERDGLRAVRTNHDGTFKEWGLRPGTYVAGVVETLEPGGAASPDFQEQLRLHGQRFSLTEGQQVDLELEPSRELR